MSNAVSARIDKRLEHARDNARDNALGNAPGNAPRRARARLLYCGRSESGAIWVSGGAPLFLRMEYAPESPAWWSKDMDSPWPSEYSDSDSENRPESPAYRPESPAYTPESPALRSFGDTPEQ